MSFVKLLPDSLRLAPGFSTLEPSLVPLSLDFLVFLLQTLSLSSLAVAVRQRLAVSNKLDEGELVLGIS